MIWIRRVLARIHCQWSGHDPVKTITGIHLDEVYTDSAGIGWSGTITDSQHDCKRCGRVLPEFSYEVQESEIMSEFRRGLHRGGNGERPGRYET